MRFWTFCLLLLSLASPARAQQLAVTTHLTVTPRDVVVQETTYLGRPALKVSLSDDMQARMLAGLSGDQPTFATLPITFQNGTLEVDVAAELNGKGADDARAFVGLAYHINGDVSKFESIYLRMSNGRKATPPPPSPRDERAIQYFCYPDWRFRRLRAEFPGRYEQGADVAPAQWVHLRVDVSGTTVKAFVNNDPKPVLTITDARLGPDASGLIGLWVDDGTDAYFANLSVISTPPTPSTTPAPAPHKK
jgi:hypothetical protein